MAITAAEYDHLIEQLTVLEKMFEQTRIVDPVNKRVLYAKHRDGTELVTEVEPCFSCWDRDEFCVNCVSMRAHGENDTFFKLDAGTEKIIMVTAVPVNLGEERLVVELLKDVTRSMILDDSRLADSFEIRRLLEQANIAAVTDELTGSYNRRYIAERLPADMAATKLNHKPLTVLLTDIDHFKKVNDTYGHLAGDQVLRDFQTVLRSSIREERDWVARFGGEEFLVCLPDIDRQGALRVAERMRQAVEDAIITFSGNDIRITSSFGLCSVAADHSMDDQSLIDCADNMLYEAKRSGRNRVM